MGLWVSRETQKDFGAGAGPSGERGPRRPGDFVKGNFGICKVFDKPDAKRGSERFITVKKTLKKWCTNNVKAGITWVRKNPSCKVETQFKGPVMERDFICLNK